MGGRGGSIDVVFFFKFEVVDLLTLGFCTKTKKKYLEGFSQVKVFKSCQFLTLEIPAD